MESCTLQQSPYEQHSAEQGPLSSHALDTNLPLVRIDSLSFESHHHLPSSSPLIFTCQSQYGTDYRYGAWFYSHRTRVPGIHLEINLAGLRLRARLVPEDGIYFVYRLPLQQSKAKRKDFLLCIKTDSITRNSAASTASRPQHCSTKLHYGGVCPVKVTPKPFSGGIWVKTTPNQKWQNQNRPEHISTSFFQLHVQCDAAFHGWWGFGQSKHLLQELNMQHNGPLKRLFSCTRLIYCSTPGLDIGQPLDNTAKCTTG
ncbi:hypothetical protein QBC37DRAFT_57042 [Rhypophila decipiens]|uniref:Uncharacterized protein n=1 Tax=Rhypophila decipiens TaxID=261697 RepID=A0AAN6YEX5_9PEZI|nr:hypothetical protein QBC37DRAFT_57042 [Rhypophila decipiens]